MRRKFLYACLILLFFTYGSTVAAKSKHSLKPGNIIDLPAAGIKFRPFKNFRQISIPSVAAYAYKNKQTGQRVETYDPVDLWRRDQQIAKFQGEKGIIVLATLKHLIPHTNEAILM